MVVKRRSSIDISQLEDCLKQYLKFNPSIVRRRWHYPLLKALEFMRSELGLQSIRDLLRCETKQLALAIQAWINKRAEEASIKTIKVEVYLIRSFLSFYDIEVPLRKIKFPRKAGRTRIDRLPSLSDLQRLISSARSPRLRLILMMLCLTGMRLNECLSVRREHIDLERGIIIVPPENTKMGRGREIPIPSELREELKRYLEKHYPYERGYLFCVKNNPEKRIHISRFYEKYVMLLKRLGLDEKTPDGSAYRLHPHIFRKWYRTQLEAVGVNRALIDLWVGHNSNSVDKLYFLPTPEMIKKEFEKANNALKIFGTIQAAEVSELSEKVEQLEAFISKILRQIAIMHPEDVIVPTDFGDLNYEQAVRLYLKGRIDRFGPLSPRTPREAKEILEAIKKEKERARRIS
jgi:integrase